MSRSCAIVNVLSCLLIVVQCIELLIECGTDVNARDNTQGSSPLFEAVRRRKKKAVNVLLTAKADPNIARSDGK